MEKDNIMKGNEVAGENKAEIVVENGAVKTTLNENSRNTGWMDLETARQRLHSFVDNLEKTYGNADSNK